MMDLISIGIAFGVLICFSFFHVVVSTLSRKRKRLPPGPAPLPIIGNLHLFAAGAGKLNTNLTKLHKTYGPMVYLKLGGLPTVVVSSPSAAKEILQKQESAFSSKFIPDVIYHTDIPKYSIAWRPSDAQWRSLRKIMVTNIFTNKSLEASQHLRYKKVRELIDYCHTKSETGQVVEIGRVVFSIMLNLMSNTIFSKDLVDYYSDSAKEFQDTVQNILVESTTLNVVDFFPVLQNIIPQGLRHQAPVHFNKLLKIFDGLFDERLEQRRLHDTTRYNDVLDIFLDYSQEHPDEIEINHIKLTCLDLFVGAIDTTPMAIEWAMAELLKTPKIIRKARDELAGVIGKGNPIKETDVARLPYLQCIVKETFRLHPPGPFLFPRKSEQDVEVCGYIIPRDSVMLINIWSLGRDSNSWNDPLIFKPERFQELDIDLRGHNFELLPFGAGRRSCPGLPLAMKFIQLILASMINLFDWKLEGHIALEDLNLEEKFGLTIHKAHSLRAIPISLY